MILLLALALFIFLVAMLDILIAKHHAKRDAWLCIEDENKRRKVIYDAMRQRPAVHDHDDDAA